MKKSSSYRNILVQSQAELYQQRHLYRVYATVYACRKPSYLLYFTFVMVKCERNSRQKIECTIFAIGRNTHTLTHHIRKWEKERKWYVTDSYNHKNMHQNASKNVCLCTLLNEANRITTHCQYINGELFNSNRIEPRERINIMQHK